MSIIVQYHYHMMDFFAHINQVNMSQLWFLHDSSAVLQAHSPPFSIIAASHVATVFAKQVAFQGGSWFQGSSVIWSSKSPLSDANNNSCIPNPTWGTQRLCCLQSRRTQHWWRGWGAFRFMCFVNATCTALTLSLWNVRCRREHSPVWCSPWPSGWRGSASPGRPKHPHSLPYGQQNSLGKPRETWWEHVNVTWGCLAQQGLLLVVT